MIRRGWLPATRPCTTGANPIAATWLGARAGNPEAGVGNHFFDVGHRSGAGGVIDHGLFILEADLRAAHPRERTQVVLQSRSAHDAVHPLDLQHRAGRWSPPDGRGPRRPMGRIPTPVRAHDDARTCDDSCQQQDSKRAYLQVSSSRRLVAGGSSASRSTALGKDSPRDSLGNSCVS